MSTNNSTLENAIARAGRRGFTVRETKGRDDFPFQLVGPAMTLDGLRELVDQIDRGIGHLNDSVPESGAAAAETADDAPDPIFGHGGSLDDLSAELESLTMVASMGVNQLCSEQQAVGIFDLLSRECDRISDRVSELARDLRDRERGAE